MGPVPHLSPLLEMKAIDNFFCPYDRLFIQFSRLPLVDNGRRLWCDAALNDVGAFDEYDKFLDIPFP